MEGMGEHVERPEFPGWASWSFPGQATERALEVARRGLPIVSIDVECVAIGPKWNDREPGQVGLATATQRDGQPMHEPRKACWYIKPRGKVHSYLEPLTGLNEKLIEERGVQLEEALAGVRKWLTPDTVLVGQNIGQDIDWLGLEQGVDYACTVDLADCLQFWEVATRRYRVYSLEHVAKAWLGEEYAEGMSHDATNDADWSVRVFEMLCELFVMQRWDQLQYLEQLVLSTEPKLSFAKRNPVYEGCEVRRPKGDAQKGDGPGKGGGSPPGSMGPHTNGVFLNGAPQPIRTSGRSLDPLPPLRGAASPVLTGPVPPPPPWHAVDEQVYVPPAPPMPPQQSGVGYPRYGNGKGPGHLPQAPMVIVPAPPPTPLFNPGRLDGPPDR